MSCCMLQRTVHARARLHAPPGAGRASVNALAGHRLLHSIPAFSAMLSATSSIRGNVGGENSFALPADVVRG